MYQFSPNKLCANIDKLVSEKNINELEKIKNLLLEYHPESEELKKVIKYCNQVEKEIIYEKELEKKKRLQAVNKLKKKYDDVSGITWYKTPYFIHYDDVEILEDVYLHLRPWIKNHPNLGNISELSGTRCTHCNSKNIRVIDNKFYFTSVGKYNLYRCKDCGGISRGRDNLNISKIKLAPILK